VVRVALTVILAAAATCSVWPTVGRANDSPPSAGRTTSPADDPDVTRWERDVAALEALDRTERDPDDAILFIGSSSIRLWDTMSEDMAPHAVIRRGYGGARYRDLCHFANRLVASHEPRAIVVFVANDITSPDASPTPEHVMIDVRATHAAIRSRHPDTPIFYVAVTPTESRWRAWPSIRRLNDLIEAMARENTATFFIATADGFLDRDTGRPRPELFRNDRLHLSAAGYDVWADIISTSLDNVLADRPEARRTATGGR